MRDARSRHTTDDRSSEPGIARQGSAIALSGARLALRATATERLKPRKREIQSICGLTRKPKRKGIQARTWSMLLTLSRPDIPEQGSATLCTSCSPRSICFSRLSTLACCGEQCEKRATQRGLAAPAEAACRDELMPPGKVNATCSFTLDW